MTTLIWFRDDLRVADHPALHAAAGADGIVALFVLDEESEHLRTHGGAARWWLHHSLAALTDTLGGLGVPLILRRGPARAVVPAVARECAATRVYWNRRYGPVRETDSSLKADLGSAGIEAHSFPGDVLFEPWTVSTRQGTPYRVYSAFWRAATVGPGPAAPLPAPRSLKAAPAQPPSAALDQWGLLPQAPDWSGGLAARWTPGEPAAQERLHEFFEGGLADYARRDLPAESVGSELSPRLRWGELSPRQVWHAALAAPGEPGMFLSELGWREFAKHTEYHAGPLHTANLDDRFADFPWRKAGEHEAGDVCTAASAASAADPASAASSNPVSAASAADPADDPSAQLLAWQRGRTGFGIVDAGMRELWQTGFMHNRVRMITASLLTKNLMLDWRVGEAWFWDTLVDADPASNPFNWQWVAGCGADAAPYFRIFNPELQAHKFDPQGRYVQKWAPDSAGITPVVDLKESRARALAAYRALPR